MLNGARTTGGNLSQDLQGKVDAMLNEFVIFADKNASLYNKLRYATVRTRHACDLAVLVDDDSVALIGQITHGMTSVIYYDQKNKRFSLNDLHSIASFDLAFNDYFIVIFPKKLLDEASNDRAATIEAIAQKYVKEEIERFNYMINLVQVSPIFGAANYKLDDRLVFVLMPFNEKRDKVYNNIIKPAIESESLGLVCKRADDIKSNKAIIQDIWKSICEARIIIADLSDLNANVMYELGIAHTVGKDTILLYEKSEDIKFPFDLAHIRRIEYTNEICATKKLETDLLQTVKSVISGKVLHSF